MLAPTPNWPRLPEIIDPPDDDVSSCQHWDFRDLAWGSQNRQPGVTADALLTQAADFDCPRLKRLESLH